MRDFEKESAKEVAVSGRWSVVVSFPASGVDGISHCIIYYLLFVELLQEFGQKWIWGAEPTGTFPG